MSKENSKKLYDHYVAIGYKKAAEDMLNKYPEFEEKPKSISKKKEETEEQKD